MVKIQNNFTDMFPVMRSSTKLHKWFRSAKQPADLNLLCFKKKDKYWFSRTRVNMMFNWNINVTVLPAQSDVMFWLQSYQDLELIDHLCINPIRRIRLIHK